MQNNIYKKINIIKYLQTAFCCCLVVAVQGQVANHWVGGFDNLWHTADNWSLGAVPKKDHLVEISNGIVVVNEEASCGQLTVSERATLKISEGQLGIAYNGPLGDVAVTNNGNIIVKGTFFIDRSGSQAEIGLENRGKIINHTEMVIRDGIGDDGIRTYDGQFINYGLLRIENDNGSGIKLEGGYFLNEGIVKNSGFSGSHFIAGELGIFINDPCGKVYSGSAPIFSKGFKNAGMIVEEGVNPSMVDVNTGVIWNLQGGDFWIRIDDGLITTDEKYAIWTGCKSSDFDDADNWGYIAEVIPSNDSHRFIPSDAQGHVDPVYLVESPIIIDYSGELHIEEGANLSIDGSLTQNVSVNGLENSGDLIVEGEMSIRNIETFGIVNKSTGVVSVEEGGELDFFGITTSLAINNWSDAKFTNSGLITIEFDSNVGIRNYGHFENIGSIIMSQDLRLGIEVFSGMFISYGAITINNTNWQSITNHAMFMNYGDLYLSSIFFNVPDGQFYNFGHINSTSSVLGISNLGEVYNLACAELRIKGKIENLGVFRNKGFLQSEYDDSHDIVNGIENYGFISDLNYAFANSNIDNHGTVLQGVTANSNSIVDDYLIGGQNGFVFSSNELNTSNDEHIGILDPIINSLIILESNDGDGTYRVSSFVEMPGCDEAKEFFVNITINDQNASAVNPSVDAFKNNNQRVSILPKSPTTILFPNPTSGRFNIQLDEGLELASVLVRDFRGNIILEKDTKEEEPTILTMESQPSGVYTVQWMDNHGEAYFEKLVVTK